MPSHTQQEKELIRIILQNPYVNEILHSNPFPQIKDWYLAAGGIMQSVWNHMSGYEITKGIKDYDLIYYDPNLEKAAQNEHSKRIREQFKHFPVEIDVVNEARVHLWFEEYFQNTIDQYTSCEDAIRSWNPCGAIGVRKNGKNFEICAPYGLNDIFEMTLRPNKSHFLQFSYEDKAQKWSAKWPTMKIVPWDEA
jgi:uncharacterized protein